MPPLQLDDRRTLVTRFDPRAAEYARVTVQELQASLLDTAGATIITLTALTVPSYRKTGCPYKNNVQKLARVNGILNWCYEDSVNRQREREGLPQTFESMPRRWGSHLNKTPFISHVNIKGEHKLYLKFKVQAVCNVAYLTLDGQDIPYEEIEPFLEEKERNTRQGVLDEVIEKDYTVSNLLCVYYNRMGYIVS